ncbi:hypothetical protein SAMN05428948_3519 [Massilia sp. CF038]|nr:hypothetical protein SAMN05428948_3519 [Massilia sp. CF038]
MVVAVLAVVWLVRLPWMIRARRQRERDFFAQIERQFQALQVDDPDPLRCFDGSRATVVQDSVRSTTHEGRNKLTGIERYARNETGEYFYLIANGVDPPFFKHLSQEEARLALGLAWRAPPVQIDA